jgi:hypothetical protein
MIQSRTLTNPLDQPINCASREWPAALGLEHECASRVALEFAQRPHFIARNGSCRDPLRLSRTIVYAAVRET